jgi:hypothetical protein
MVEMELGLGIGYTIMSWCRDGYVSFKAQQVI